MMNYDRHEYRSSSRDSRRRRSARVYPAPRPAEAACRMPRAKPLARSRRVQASATRDSAPARQPTRLRPRDSRDTTRPARLVPPRSSRRGGTRKPPRRRRAGRGSRTPRRATTEAGGGSPPRPSHWLAETHRQRRKARLRESANFDFLEEKENDGTLRIYSASRAVASHSGARDRAHTFFGWHSRARRGRTAGEHGGGDALPR